MIINRAYLFKLYPNKKQKEIINKTIGSTRFVYNYYLSEKQEEYKNTKRSKNAYEECKDLKILEEEYVWLKEVDSCALRNAIFNLEDAYLRFYKQGGYPNYKKKRISGSYKTNCIRGRYKGKKYESIELDLENKIIKLPKLKDVKIRGYRNKNKIDGKILSATIRRVGKNYYVSVLVEEEIEIPINNKAVGVGIDVGIKDMVITSDGEKYNNYLKNKMKRVEKKIAGLNKMLSRSKVGSKNRYKIKIKIQRAYQKIKNMRKYLLHEITNKIIEENNYIMVESLKIKNMMKNHKIAGSLSRNSLSELIRILEYKCRWKGKILHKIETYYASSQTCSKCEYKNKEIKDLRIRTWKCPRCGSKHDRDINAAINILIKGMEEMAIIEQS